MKKIWGLLAGGLALCADGPAVRPTQVPTSLPSAVRGMMAHAFLVAPHVYAFHAPLSGGPVPIANEMLVEQSDGLVLVDAGKTRGEGERIVTLIHAISGKPVKAVIITHWHQDHVLGLGPIREAWPDARIIASARTRDHIAQDDSYAGAPAALSETAKRNVARAAGLRAYVTEYTPQLRDPKTSAVERRGWATVLGMLDQRIADEQGTYLVQPTVTFDTTYRLDDPLAPVEARMIGPAHTDGDIVVWTPRQRVVAAGDMVVAPIPFPGQNVREWPDTLRHLKALRPAVIVPGHGPVLHGTVYVDRLIVAMAAFARMAERLPIVPALTEDGIADHVDVRAQVRAFAHGDPWLAYWCRQYFPDLVWHAYSARLAAQAATIAERRAP